MSTKFRSSKSNQPPNHMTYGGGVVPKHFPRQCFHRNYNRLMIIEYHQFIKHRKRCRACKPIDGVTHTNTETNHRQPSTWLNVTPPTLLNRRDRVPC